MSNTDIAGKLDHVTLPKNVANKAVALALTQAVVTPGYDARSILAAVLQHGQRVIERLPCWAATNYSDDATHDFLR
jgi:hypothetical protein